MTNATPARPTVERTYGLRPPKSLIFSILGGVLLSLILAGIATSTASAANADVTVSLWTGGNGQSASGCTQLGSTNDWTCGTTQSIANSKNVVVNFGAPESNYAVFTVFCNGATAYATNGGPSVWSLLGDATRDVGSALASEQEGARLGNLSAPVTTSAGPFSATPAAGSVFGLVVSNFGGESVAVEFSTPSSGNPHICTIEGYFGTVGLQNLSTSISATNALLSGTIATSCSACAKDSSVASTNTLLGGTLNTSCSACAKDSSLVTANASLAGVSTNSTTATKAVGWGIGILLILLFSPIFMRLFSRSGV